MTPIEIRNDSKLVKLIVAQANGERVDMDHAVAKIDQLNAAATAELANAVNPTRAQMTTASLRMALIGYVDELTKATTPAIPKAVDNVTGAVYGSSAYNCCGFNC